MSSTSKRTHDCADEAQRSGARGSHADWREAGEAWGDHANDWSCLYEHHALDVIVALYSRLQPGPGTALLDIACGSGLALRLAASTGASVAGIDAAAELIAVARNRIPTGDLRVGSMFALPWPDASFDAAVSLNGIWGGCEEALDEAYRVLRPGGRIGISFWGQGPPLDIREFFKVFAAHAPNAHRASMRQLNNISVPGVAESMLEDAGFEVEESGARVSVAEWPDAEIAWRAVSSIGPAVPALRTGDVAAIKRDVLAALERCRDERGVYRSRSDQRFVIARRP
jgi:ubiquinone/menaquinone biosynthesis C-methylase UbiE